MAAEKHRLPLIPQAEDDVPDLDAADRIKARHGLVQQDQLRVMDQGLRQPDALEHAFRELAELAIAGFAQSHHLEEVPDPFRQLTRPQPRQLPVERQKFLGGEVVVKIRSLRQKPDPGPCVQVAGRPPEDFGAAATLAHEAQQDFEGGRLPRPVRAEESVDLAPPHGQGKPVQSGDLVPAKPAGPEAFRQPFYPNHVHVSSPTKEGS